MRKYFLWFIIAIFAIPIALLSNNLIQEKIGKKLELAESYYMLMLDEGIGTYAQKKAENYIQEAEKILKKSSLSENEKKIYTLQISAIKKELEDTIEVKYHTLVGYFPLLKYTASSFFFSPEESEVHTLVKSPDFVAISNAAKALSTSLGGPAEAVINSVPNDSKLEKLAFEILNSKSSLSLHTDKNIVSVLGSSNLIQKFHDNNITKEVYKKLFDAYSGNPLYVITITKDPSDSREYFYSLNASYYNKNGYNQTKSVSVSGYSIDERSNWLKLVLIHLILISFAFAFTYWNQKKSNFKLYAMSLLFFLFGRILPIIVVPSIMAFKPDADTHVIYSAWWIFVMGVAVFVLPIVAIKMFYGRIVEYLPLPRISGKGEIVGVSIASGILAFLTVPYIFSYGNTLDVSQIVAFFLLSVAVLVSGYVMGKVLDDNDKMNEKNLILSAITSALIMAAFLHGESLYLSIISVITVVLAAALLYKHQQRIKKEAQENTKLEIDETLVSDVECSDIGNIDFHKIIQNPPYQKFDYYQEVFNALEAIYEGSTTYCVLKGDGGAGKTVTAKILTDAIGKKLMDSDTSLVYLSSNCERKDGEEVPYAMFHELLDSTMSIDIFGQREKDEKFDNVVNMASRFLMGPVASFLASGSSDGEKSFSKNDIYVFVKNKLTEFSKQSTVILFVDDFQWIDTASKELLKYLMEEFKPGQAKRILFLFTVRDTKEGNSKVHEFGLEPYTHTIGFIDRREQRQLLERSFCISPESSHWIINWVAQQNEERVYPYVLVDTVGNLVRSNVFEIVDDRFTISNEFDFENPPIPEGPKAEVRKFLEENPHYREVLSIAALFGKEFQVSILASALDMSYLECVRILDEIERKSGFVFDLTQKDDVFQFRSQILLDALRDVIDYSTEGILSTHVSQTMRHYHALAANALQQKEQHDSTSQLIMQIANHYYAAGKLYADQAVDYLLKATESARNLFEYDNALQYLDKVDEILDITGKSTTQSKELRFLIECDKSNVQNIGAADAAESVIRYIEENNIDNEHLKFVAVRACYDAALQNGYDQQWFAKTRDMAQKYLLGSNTPLIKAEGFHFVALSIKPQSDEEKKSQTEFYEKAIELTKDNHPQSYAKIANSLAEALSYGSDEEKAKAKVLFLESLDIKENAEIKDFPGIARTYGGLGRLVFFSKDGDIEEAKSYFEKDLKIAEEIDDKRGISQMNSFLGSCALKQAEYEKSIEHYDKSIQMRNNPFDVRASFDGKLNALVQLNDENRIEEAMIEYEIILDEIGEPQAEFLLKGIVRSLEKYPECNLCQKIKKRFLDVHKSS